MIFPGYLIAALAAIFIGNAVPHLTRGSAGYLHRVPWRVPASPAENVLWAGINLLIGTRFFNNPEERGQQAD
jgi:hypothetical protein